LPAVSDLGDTFQELRLLGPRRAVFRGLYESINRSGLRCLLQPPDADAARRWKKAWRGPSPGDWLAFWRMEKRPFFAFRDPSLTRQALQNLLDDPARQACLEDAREAARGNIKCFSKDRHAYGDPIDWHFNPAAAASSPPRRHWSRSLLRGAAGDVKWIWEANRFPQVFSLVRAWALSGDPSLPPAFFRQLAGWEAANPYRLGANWASGQEVAIRLLAWLFGAYHFLESPEATGDDAERFLRLVYLHAEHIEENIDFARFAVPNNHLIGEALGLYAAGRLFPWFAQASQWERLGRDLLLESTGQFKPDGGYCQNSHNYHRLALHDYLWAVQIARASEAPDWTGPLRDCLSRSGELLAAFVNGPDGRLPNWGSNDGALLNPWTSCGFSDFRPVLSAIYYLATAERRFEPGPWDEELFWFFGESSLEAPVRTATAPDASFPQSGIHVLRGAPGTFLSFRCGSVVDPFGQADQLHVDYWERGENIALDGGSFSYADPLLHPYFQGTRSHNTIVVNGRDQMRPRRRFSWLDWTVAGLERKGPRALEGHHLGYEASFGVRHRRAVALLENGCEVTDRLEKRDARPCTFRLAWNLADRAWTLEEVEGEWVASAPFSDRRVVLRVSCGGAGRAELLRDRRGLPAGIHSRYYGSLEPCVTLLVSCESTVSREFVSRFESFSRV
jgi:asparagine synthase (glutamine-hydrolysing)